MQPASISDARLPPISVAVCDTADVMPVVMRVAMMAAIVVDMILVLMAFLEGRDV